MFVERMENGEEMYMNYVEKDYKFAWNIWKQHTICMGHVKRVQICMKHD